VATLSAFFGADSWREGHATVSVKTGAVVIWVFCYSLGRMTRNDGDVMDNDTMMTQRFPSFPPAHLSQQPRHLALVTDAWKPQINGVVRTLQAVVSHLRQTGWRVSILQPGDFRCVPCPSYPEIPVAIHPWPRLIGQLNKLRPDHVHIVTEGPLGLTARLWCGWHGYRFTTSFHTRVAEYLHEYFRLPLSFGYRGLRWFHNRASATLVPTPSMMRHLSSRGLINCKQWSHGVDTQLFHPSRRIALDFPGPILLYAGRVSIEKNIEAFLSLDTPGTKLVVGDGPIRASLEKRYPRAVFVGMKQGEELARYYASADVLVFPSRTDTFGLVMLEALASGTPVAAFPVTGPIDVVGGTNVGVLNEDLKTAIAEALNCSRADCRGFAKRFSWETSGRIFAETLVPLKPVAMPQFEGAQARYALADRQEQVAMSAQLVEVE
jgi:glycosyltransferase involved in cell wall biosynthesis